MNLINRLKQTACHLTLLLPVSTACIAQVTVYPVGTNVSPGQKINFDLNGGTGTSSTSLFSGFDFSIDNFDNFAPPSAFGVSGLSGVEYIGTVSSGSDIAKLTEGYDLITGFGRTSFNYFRASGTGYFGWSNHGIADEGAIGFRFTSGSGHKFGWIWIDILSNNDIYVHAFAVNDTVNGSTLITNLSSPIPEPSSYATLAGLSILSLTATRRRRKS